MSRVKNSAYSDYIKLEQRTAAELLTADRFHRRDVEALRYAGRWEYHSVLDSVNIGRFFQSVKLHDPIFDVVWKIANEAQKEMLRYSHAVKQFYIGEDELSFYKTARLLQTGTTLSYEDKRQLMRICDA